MLFWDRLTTSKQNISAVPPPSPLRRRRHCAAVTAALFLVILFMDDPQNDSDLIDQSLLLQPRTSYLLSLYCHMIEKLYKRNSNLFPTKFHLKVQCCAMLAKKRNKLKIVFKLYSVLFQKRQPLSFVTLRPVLAIFYQLPKYILQNLGAKQVKISIGSKAKIMNSR